MKMNILDAVKNPRRVIFAYGIRGGFRFLDDETYTKLMYRMFHGRKLNLENPKLFTEKICWLKINNHQSQYTRMVDKYEAKEYVGSIIGEQYIIPTLGVWDTFEEIDFSELPDQFVLKTTHDSGGVVVCKNKASFDIEQAKKKLNASLKRNYYWAGREWNYKNVKPRIIAEKYMPIDDAECAEFKMFCFNGKVTYILVCKGEAHIIGKRTNDFFDAQFDHIPVETVNPNAKEEFKKPKEFDELVRLAEILSTNSPLLRVDFYLTKQGLYFGELTFYHDSGFVRFNPQKYDAIFGSKLDISEIIKEKEKESKK